MYKCLIICLSCLLVSCITVVSLKPKSKIPVRYTPPQDICLIAYPNTPISRVEEYGEALQKKVMVYVFHGIGSNTNDYIRCQIKQNFTLQKLEDWGDRSFSMLIFNVSTHEGIVYTANVAKNRFLIHVVTEIEPDVYQIRCHVWNQGLDKIIASFHVNSGLYIPYRSYQKPLWFGVLPQVRDFYLELTDSEAVFAEKKK